MKLLSVNPYTEEPMKSAWQQGYDNSYFRKENISKPTNPVESFAYDLGEKAFKCDLHGIPKGLYCYEITGPFENGKLPVRVCPYMERKEAVFEGETHMISVCSFLLQKKVEDTMGYFPGEIMDSVKDCGENREWDDEEVIS